MQEALCDVIFEVMPTWILVGLYLCYLSSLESSLLTHDSLWLVRKLCFHLLNKNVPTLIWLIINRSVSESLFQEMALRYLTIKFYKIWSYGGGQFSRDWKYGFSFALSSLIPSSSLPPASLLEQDKRCDENWKIVIYGESLCSMLYESKL